MRKNLSLVLIFSLLFMKTNSLFSQSQNLPKEGLYPNVYKQAPQNYKPPCPEEEETCPSRTEIPGGKQGRQEKQEKQVIGSTQKEKAPYFIKDKEFEPGQIIGGVYYKVTPEKTTIVEMSNVDVKRIICPVDVQSVVFSEEKGVVVNAVGRNVFVKFKVKKIDENLEYSTVPVDIHVVCNDKVFSMVAFPKKVPAVLIYLEDKELKLKESLKKLDRLTYEEKISSLVKGIFSGNIPLEVEQERVDIKYDIYKDLLINEKVRFLLEGEGITIRFFELSYTGESSYVDLNERMFLKKEITTSPLAIALGKLRLNKGEKTQFLIIEKRLVSQEEGK